MRLFKHGKKSSIAFIKYLLKMVWQGKENAVYLLLDRNMVFDTRAYSYLPIKRGIWQHITNQNSCDVTTLFTYSHLNTQWESTFNANNYFINRNHCKFLKFDWCISCFIFHWFLLCGIKIGQLTVIRYLKWDSYISQSN